MTATPISLGSDKDTPLSAWLSQRELAERLGVSLRTLERLRTDGTGPRFSRAGKRVLYHSTDVETWLRQNSFTSTADAKHGPNKTIG